MVYTPDTNAPIEQQILDAIGALIPAGVLKFEVVTITAASTTLISLMAGTTFNTAVKKVGLKAAAAFSVNVGAVAAMGDVTLDGGVLYVFDCLPTTDLRVIAGGNVKCLVIQEG